MFGRPEITSGTIDGKIDVTGTLEKPTVKAKTRPALGLAMPAFGPGGKPVQKIRNRIAIDATLDPRRTAGPSRSMATQDQGGKLPP